MVNIDRTRTYSYTDQSKDYNKCRGIFKNGVFSVWISHIPRSEFCFNLSVSELDAKLSEHGNSNYAIYELAKTKLNEATECWIESTEEECLKIKRRQLWDEDTLFSKHSPLHSLQIDSACRVIKELYKMAYGDYPKSWLEKATSHN